MIMSIGGRQKPGRVSEQNYANKVFEFCMVEEQSQALRAYAAQAGENLLLLGNK